MRSLTCLRLPALSHYPLQPLLPTHPLPLICATCDSTMVVKQLIKIQQCQLVDRNSYKILAKRLFQLHSISSVAIVQHKKTTLISLFEISIFQNTKCDNLVSFLAQGQASNSCVCLKCQLANLCKFNFYVHICPILSFSSTFVTGLWKTDPNHTFSISRITALTHCESLLLVFYDY